MKLRRLTAPPVVGLDWRCCSRGPVSPLGLCGEWRPCLSLPGGPGAGPLLFFSPVDTSGGLWTGCCTKGPAAPFCPPRMSAVWSHCDAQTPWLSVSFIYFPSDLESKFGKWTLTCYFITFFLQNKKQTMGCFSQLGLSWDFWEVVGFFLHKACLYIKAVAAGL